MPDPQTDLLSAPANWPPESAPSLYSAAPGAPVCDLGAAIGSATWWRHLALLSLLISAAVATTVVAPLARRQGIQPHKPAPVSSVFQEMEKTEPPALGNGTAANDDAGVPPTKAWTMAKTLTVARGDTLADILLRAGVSARDAYEAVEALRPLFSPRKLRQGQSLSVTLTSQEGQETATSQPLLAQVALKTEFGQRVEVARQPQGGFAAQAVAMAVETRPVLREGPIADSLYLAGTRAGVPAAILIEMIQIFSYSVDFQREIRAGDVFRVLYEERTAEDGETALGPIAYGELILSGKSRALYRFTPSDDGRTDYFSPDGKSARRLLMKTPIDGARLTSRYGARKHPVLGYVRNHPGIDFGAPTGTPIYAAGDGVVEKAARWGSYGNYIRIRHANGYKTAYAHLSKYGKGVRAGARVTQGQVIGYVGATGRVTGPHLHYEVYANDSRINPLTLKLPTGRVLSGGVLASFRQAKAELDIATGLSLVAQDMVEGQTSGANPARGTD